MKILVVSHTHPDFSVGGAELAAYNLFKSLREMAEITEVVFLAGTENLSVSPGAVKLYRSNEYLWRQQIDDWFRLRAEFSSSLLDELTEFLFLVSPDVIFIHHYAYLGVEILKRFKDVLPEAFVSLTLHEYLAICNRNGQLVKNRTKKLCYQETIEGCSTCFPEYAASDFWLRKHYLLGHFAYVDAFISPSRYLKQRYVEWGIIPDRIHVIENGQPTLGSFQSPALSKSDRTRFGFFGQITEYKGLEVLLQAVTLLPKATRETISIEVHGANLELQGQELQEQVERLRAPLVEEGCLRWAGAYEPQELSSRMRNVDWVVVPSIWWENSPMVIQEAFIHRKPVICSNIGGMAEKVRDEIDGLHFEVRNPSDLAEVLKRAATDPELWNRLSNNTPTPPSYAECATYYVKLAQGHFQRRFDDLPTSAN